MSAIDQIGSKNLLQQNVKTARLVVMVSGYGSNLQAVLDACKTGYLPAEVVAVISNRQAAYGLERARLEGIPAVYMPKHKEQERNDYDVKLAQVVAEYQPDWVILAGWMRLLSQVFLDRFSNRVVNLHPALPGMFPGADAIARAYEVFKTGVITQTGVMVHLVLDEGVDNGPVLAHETVSIQVDDTLEVLEARVHQVEHRLLVDALKVLLMRKG